MSNLNSYLRAHFLPAPGATCKLSEISQGFRAGLTKSEASRWTRARIVAELVQGGYKIATNEVGVAVVVGLASLQPVAVRDGRLVAG